MSNRQYVSQPTSYFAALGTEGDWLHRQVSDFWDKPENQDLECVDNGRVCDEGIPEEAAAYRELQESGCCGSCDVTFGPSPTGRTYSYGFNYGH